MRDLLDTLQPPTRRFPEGEIPSRFNVVVGRGSCGPRACNGGLAPNTELSDNEISSNCATLKRSMLTVSTRPSQSTLNVLSCPETTSSGSLQACLVVYAPNQQGQIHVNRSSVWSERISLVTVDELATGKCSLCTWTGDQRMYVKWVNQDLVT